MKATVNEESGWRRVLEIEVEPETVTREEEVVLEGFRKQMKIPGFRKGKVPKELARKYMGGELREEVLRRVLPKAFEEALRENEIHPIGDPTIQDLKFEPGEPLTFTATVEVAPQVEITGYKGLKVNRVVHDIDETRVEQTLDHIRQERATLEDADRPARSGDTVDITYIELNEDGDPITEKPVEISLELGSERTPEVFTKELEGAAAGDRKPVPLEYPADYPDADLAGKVRRFDVTVIKVQEKVWPAVDDALARELLGEEEATVATLNERIRQNHEMELKIQSDRELEQRILNRLLEINPFDLPQGVVESTLDRMLESAARDRPNMTDEEKTQAREQYRSMVEGRYKVDILMDAVGRQESITVTDADIDEQINAFAEREGRPAEKIRAELKKEDGLDRLRRDMFQRRVMGKLAELADVAVVSASGENISAPAEEEKK